jgi:colanic acid/amylovoran biosynthesis glycosyltransferase
MPDGRIAYVMSRFPKVTETFVLTEILELERRGVRVDVYPLLRESEQIMHPAAKPVVARAHYLPFVSRPVIASQLWWLRRRPRAYLGALCDALRGTWGSVNFFAGALAIFPKVAHAARLMERDQVRHVHCHFANHPALAGFVIHRLTGIPFSFTAHGSDLHVDRHMLAEKVAEAAFVTTVSEFNRDVIIRHCGGRGSDKVHVIHCGVDTGAFAPNGASAAAGRPLRVLCVGTLHEVKGQSHLVEACRRLAATGVDVHCTLVGDGPDRDRLARQIETASLGGRVVLRGALTRGEVIAALHDADVVAAPSVPARNGKREGIPVALMEAMAAGVPVVASDLSGIPELVEHDVTGLLVPPGDAEAIAAAIARLAADPQLRERLAASARERVCRDFALDRSVVELAGRFGVELGRAA